MKRSLIAGALVAGLAVSAALVAPTFAAPVIAAGVVLLLAVAILFSNVKLSGLQLGVLAIFAIAGAAALLSGYSWVDVGAAGVLLANGAPALEMKQIEEAIDKATKKVKETTDRMQQSLDQAIAECKRLETVTGKTNDELKAASEISLKAQTELKGIMDRVLEVEQKLAKRPSNSGGEVKSLGLQAVESEQFKAFASAGSKGGRLAMDPVDIGSFHKAAITTATTQTTGTISMVPAERVGFVAPVERQFMVRSLLPVYSTESNMIEFWRENVLTNAAAPQNASSPNEQDMQLKAEGGITFTLTQVAMTTLAWWIPVSRQIYQDAKQLAAYIDGRLRYGLMYEEEDEVLNSTGQNGELNGLYNQATAYNRRATADSQLDTILKAFLQVTLSDFNADGIVMSNKDWTDILLLKDTQGRYLFGDPSAAQQNPVVWGRRCVPTNSITEGNFLTGAFQMSAALWDREQATVRVADQHSDFFIRNALCLLAEERIALAVYRPTGLVKGSFGAAAGQPG